MKITGLECPLCDGNMKYKNQNGTHVWICEECSCVTMEFYTDDDLDNLSECLKGE